MNDSRPQYGSDAARHKLTSERRRSGPLHGLAPVSAAVLVTVALLCPTVAQAASRQSKPSERTGTSVAGKSTKNVAKMAVRSVAVPGTCRLSSKLVSPCGILFGAYVLPQGGESQTNAYGRFSRLVHHDLDIIHSYHRGTEKFPTAAEKSLIGRPGVNRRLLINWKPENGLSWAQVAAGDGDSVIDAEANYIKKSFMPKFFLGIHHEPEEEVRESPGSGYTAEDYRNMYRHVVDRFRAAGVTNVVYVMNYMGAQKWAQKSWFKDVYPGNSYVDWLAFDPYMTATIGSQTGTFKRLMNQYWGDGSWRGEYRWAVQQHPGKPVMLAEWGIGEKPGEAAWKAKFYQSVVRDAKNFPQLKALVYFSNPQGASGAEPDTSARSLTSFRTLATSHIFQ